jgi:ParB family transcriptional regulator, chromosome partitioning protein
MNNRVLGRGLSSLLKEEVLPVDTGTTLNNLLNIEQIEVGKYQPRKNFNEEKLRELADSIISNGLVQPIIVGPTINGKYQIIS